MSDLLTHAELAAIAEREAKATKGPWKADTTEPYDCVVWGPGDDQHVGNVGANVVMISNDHEIFSGDISNTDFIAHARADIPALLRHIAALDTLVEVVKPAPADDPELDGTDFAHAAWWRGHEQTTAMFCHHVQAILDGRDVKDESVSLEPWHTIRQRLLALVKKPAPATDVDALLAEAEKKVKHARAKLSALCHGRETFTMRIPADRTYDHDFAFADALDACNDLATALRETLAREVAEKAARVEAEREYGEMRNNILKAADDIDLWRSRAKRETDLRLKYEEEANRARTERDAAIARAEKAEAEIADANASLALCAENTAAADLAQEVEFLKAELGALGPVEWCGRRQCSIRVVKEAQ